MIACPLGPFFIGEVGISYNVNSVLEKSLTAGAVVIFGSRGYAHYHLSAKLVDYRHLIPKNFSCFAVLRSFQERLDVQLLNFDGGLSTRTDDSLCRFKFGYASGSSRFHIGYFITLKEEYEMLCAAWANKVRPNFAKNMGIVS